MEKNKKISKIELLQLLSKDQVAKHPKFGAGDTICVHEKIFDENKKFRIQKFTGVVLKRHGSGVAENIILRKESSGIGVEKIIFINSPIVTLIEVIRYGRVRRAYISYMRKRSGKAARIKEKKQVFSKS